MVNDLTDLCADAPALPEALKALGAGRIDAAEHILLKLLAKRPVDAAVHQLAAAIALERRDGLVALRWAMSSLELRPGHAPCLVLAGKAARLMGRDRDALDFFRRAAEGDPARAEPAFLVCVTLLELGEPKANSMLSDLLRRFPDDPAGWELLGDTLYAARKLDAALAAYGRVRSGDGSARLVLKHAAILEAQGKFDQAEQRYRQILAQDPEHAQAALRLAVGLQKSGDSLGARNAFRDVVRISPTVAEAWFALGLIEQDLGNLEGAIASYRAALTARPDMAEAAVNMGICLQGGGDLKAAKDAYGMALGLRADTFGRIAQALSAASVGEVWLDHAQLRRSLDS